MSRVNRKRGEHRENLILKVFVQQRAFGILKIHPANDANAFFFHRRLDGVDKQLSVTLLQAVGLAANLGQHLLR